MTPAEIKKLVHIAQENIPELENRPDLEARQSDELDFFETSVWSLKAALVAAYELGKAEGRRVESHPPVLDRETWDKVQGKLKAEKETGAPFPHLGYKLEGNELVVNDEEARVIRKATRETLTKSKKNQVSSETEKELRQMMARHYAKHEADEEKEEEK
jgi:hypothetical protein